MERKILFKAKRLDNGEWVKGDLQHSASLTKSVQVYKTIIATPIKSNHGEILGHSLYEVAPSTVCQFTGLKDKDGVEVWEHDILRDTDADTFGELIFKHGVFLIGCLPVSEYVFEDTLDLAVVCSKFDRKEGEM